ncbi:MAG: DUF2090 domain-containing protein, partial [Burkholderiales bacterium]|nr:DUF2090 domain-containing protein [Burkholderiales bacterium]
DTGVLLDDHYGTDVLPMLTGKNIWIARPVEVPGSIPVAFETGPNVGLVLRTWPAEHVVKCLVFYHPDDSDDLKATQIASMRELSDACHHTGHELLLEIIPPERAGEDTNAVGRAMSQLYDAGIRPDWWKLPPSTDPRIWHALGALIETRDKYCQGMLVLGLEASTTTLEASFAAAAGESRCRGFAVGRTIFSEPAAAWFSGTATDADVVAEIARNYRDLITLWDRAAETPQSDQYSPQLEKGLVT